MRRSATGRGRALPGEHSALGGRDDAEADEHEGRAGGGVLDGDGIVKKKNDDDPLCANHATLPSFLVDYLFKSNKHRNRKYSQINNIHPERFPSIDKFSSKRTY